MRNDAIGKDGQTFDKIINPYAVPYDDQPPQHHPSGRTLNQGDSLRSWLGCSAFVLALGLAIAAVVIAVRW